MALMMTSRDSRSFTAALIGDGRPLILLTAVALAFAGGTAIFLSLTGHFLPHDVEFLGMRPQALCGLNQCRIVHFMIHDRISFGGVLLALAVLYAWLALFPLREGQGWAWWTLVLTNITGFGSFLAYLGYGYLDTWHAWATVLLLPVAVAGLWLTRRLAVHPVTRWPAPGRRPFSWRSAEAWGWLLWLGWGLGMAGAGAVILLVGMTRVFVPSDLVFLDYTPEQLSAINPRLIPLIAHDRAGFGGGLFTTGLLVLGIVWKAPPSRHVWQALVAAGVAGFSCAIGVHYPIGYVDFLHLLPAWLGAVIFTAGAFLAWFGSEWRRARADGHGSRLAAPPLERERAEGLRPAP